MIIKQPQIKSTAFSVLLGTGLALLSSIMPADAFTLNRQLTGDPRSGNPDGLIVDVSIATGLDAGLGTNQARWTVDINSPLHPNIKLGGFFFNLADTIKNSVTFSNYSPTGWAVQTPANNAQGSGGADFQFKTIDPPGPPNAANVTNFTNLSFIMTSSAGALTLNDFLLAPLSISNNSVLGSGQMGAHLQSLTRNANTGCLVGCSDSGFALGTYGDPEEVPEPITILGTLTALGAGYVMKRKQKQNAAKLG